jgi:putative PIN family toxin of toxin-antitoxin system
MALRNKLPVYISSEILKEYDEVLHRKKYERKILKSEADELIRIIDAIAIHRNPKTSTIPLFADETDRKFYDLAKSANAYLVTGNIKHFPQEPKILTPADFLKIQ